MQFGWYLGDPSNAFRDQVIWKRVNRGHWLVTKESVQAIENAQTAAAVNDADDDNASSDNEATLQHATLHAVLLISYDDCWLTPCGNRKGPTVVTKNFEDLKLTFQAGSPTAFDIFKRDFPIVINNVNWLMNEAAIGKAPTKDFMNPSNMLRFRHVLFEKLDHESVDAASELEDAYLLSEWPVIHIEAAKARDRLVSTHRVIPLPAYDIKGGAHLT
ncbi:hypothetical protein BDN70DRAFT_194034 [Pholiota conissans]|uniref:Uncharacterized protein n=1 Tax=Pholiota conissans TaxID=109636 RepID=A0A9P5YUH8_9AGAR|nr:hypothetical protein BDN70DRAFT_194034 [Pholiota conissans]